MKPTRAAFLKLVLAQEASPYIWGSKGKRHGPEMVRAFDCSGLVTWAFHELGGPDWRALHGCARLWEELEPVEHPEPGDLAFYGSPNHVSHVMVVTSPDTCFGACGGGSKTTTLALARAQNARVKARPSIHYRPDLLGFRRLPWAG